MKKIVDVWKNETKFWKKVEIRFEGFSFVEFAFNMIKTF